MLYLDTSALVKLYLDGPERKPLTTAVSKEAIVATQEIAFIEAHAAFSRAERDGRLGHVELERLRSDFDRDWPNYLVIAYRSRCLNRLLNSSIRSHCLLTTPCISLPLRHLRGTAQKRFSLRASIGG